MSRSFDRHQKDKEADRKRKVIERKNRNEHESINNQTIIEEFRKSINTGPTFVCTCCSRFLYKKSVIQLNTNKYKKLSKNLSDSCFTNKHVHDKEWICHTCDKKLLSGRLPPQVQANDMSLTALPNAPKDLSQLELQLILKIIPFMKIVAMPRGAQHGLRGQVVLVPADLSKVSSCLPHPRHESQIIALALKRRLSDKHSVVTQYIRPEFVTNALAVLKQIHPMYKDVEIRPVLLHISNQHDLQFLKAFSHTPEKINRARNSDIETEASNEEDNSQTIVDSVDEVDEDKPESFISDLVYSRTVNTQTCTFAALDWLERDAIS